MWERVCEGDAWDGVWIECVHEHGGAGCMELLQLDFAIVCVAVFMRLFEMIFGMLLYSA